MNYWNESCPICGQNFTPEDDVVVCPDCGAPHHRACWKEKGSCAFANLHEGGYVWQSAQVQSPEQDAKTEEVVNCPRCGEPCTPDTLVCPTCGNRLGANPSPNTGYAYNDSFFMRGVEGDPDEDLDGVSVREVAVFTQQRSSAYVRKFRKQKEKNQKVGWNWAAFLFSPFWFFYRKVYKAGLVFLGIWMALCLFLAVPFSNVQSETMNVVSKYLTIDENVTLESMAEELSELKQADQQKVQEALLRMGYSAILFSLALFVPNIAAGLVADGLYKKKINRDVKSMREFAGNAQTFQMLAIRRGGVSVFGLLGCYVMISVFINIVFSLTV